jgi:hypothetical protein
MELSFESDFITDIVAEINASPYPVNGLRMEECVIYRHDDPVNGSKVYELRKPVTAEDVGFVLELLDYCQGKSLLLLVGGGASCHGDAIDHLHTNIFAESAIIGGHCRMIWWWKCLPNPPPLRPKKCHLNSVPYVKGRLNFRLAWHCDWVARHEWYRDVRPPRHNPWLSSTELIADVAALAEASTFPLKGLRVDHARLYRPGDKMRNSEIDWTGYTAGESDDDFYAGGRVPKRFRAPLQGVCTTWPGGPEVSAATIAAALKIIDFFVFDILVLCGGDRWEDGKDTGEKVLFNARCIMVWRWPLVTYRPLVERTKWPKSVHRPPPLGSKHHPRARRHEYASPPAVLASEKPGRRVSR